MLPPTSLLPDPLRGRLPPDRVAGQSGSPGQGENRVLALDGTPSAPTPKAAGPVESARAVRAAEAAAASPQAADRPKVRPRPMGPDLKALRAASQRHASADNSFDVSAESLSDLLARINISGAGVAARITDATRRVRIASLGRPVPAASSPLVAQLRVTDSRFGQERTVVTEVEVDPPTSASASVAADSVLEEEPSPEATDAPAVTGDEVVAPTAAGDAAAAAAPEASQPTQNELAEPGSLVDVIG